MTSIREYKLRNAELSKLHHRKRELENEFLCQNRYEREFEEQTPEGTVVTNSQQFEQQFQFQQQSDHDCHIDAG